jgi:hypothetical protein
MGTWLFRERDIVEKFKKVFIDKGVWEFIPVGNNLAFECKFMKYKLKQYCGLEGLKLGHQPLIKMAASKTSSKQPV